MTHDPHHATERAMKVQEVMLRAMSGQLHWIQAAEILGISDRSMRRWRERYERFGYDGLYDRRWKRPSPKRMPSRRPSRSSRSTASATADGTSPISTTSCGSTTGLR